MARKRELSSETRQSILVLRNERYSMREIAKKLKISYNGVYYSLQRTAQTGSKQSRKRSGRPCCTTKQEDKYIRVSSLRNRRLTGPQLASSLNSTRKTPVSTSTVKRRLLDFGLQGRVAKKKPYLRLANKRKRLRWAKEHRHWTEEDWKKVLWTNEYKFEVFGLQRRTFVRRRTNEKMLEECLTPSVKHGGGNVMVWGSFGAGKVGDLFRVKGILNKEGYHSILQRHAIPSGQRLIGANFVLQQDSDPKHTSKVCPEIVLQELFTAEAGSWYSIGNGVASADLNPIELLWEQLDRMVRQKCPSNQSNLWELLLEAWGAISPAYLNKLTARMPKVCNAVIAANGGFFDESKV
uniref:Transposase Tc1-like domain-containing protein n=1 Tax=Astyanax mexicanus TaxID=7994 RepID=A0A3B1IXD5_ASTMX